MNNDIAIAWLDGIRTNTKDADLREALLKGIEAIEKLEQNDKPSGKWIDDPVDKMSQDFGYKQFYCSNCNHTIRGIGAKHTKFCPNCGSANMVEEQGENT